MFFAKYYMLITCNGMIFIVVALRTATICVKMSLNQWGAVKHCKTSCSSSNNLFIVTILYKYTDFFANMVFLPLDRVTHDVELTDPTS